MSNTRPVSPTAAMAELERRQKAAAEQRRQSSLQTAQRSKEVARQLRRDRATIAAAASKLGSTSQADRSAAANDVCKTVLHGTGLSVSQIKNSLSFARVAADVIKNPFVLDLGVKGVLKLTAPSTEVDSVPASVIDRLGKLAK